MYTAIVLDQESKDNLRIACADLIPADYEVVCHHVTVNMGSHDKGPMADIPLGTEIELTAKYLGEIPGRVLAINVIGSVLRTKNKVPHVTIAINRDAGAKPKDSNDIEDWNVRTIGQRISGWLTEVA